MFTANTHKITCLSINPDKHLLAGGSWGNIWLWRLQNNYHLTHLEGHSDWVVSVAISADGNYLVSGSKDKTIKIWTLHTQQLLGTIKDHKDAVNAVLISSDQKYIISGSSDQTIKIYDLNTQKIKKTLNKHSQAVTCLAISPDGKLLFSGSLDKTIKIWKFEQGQLLSEITDYKGNITALTVEKINDQLILIAGSSEGEIKIWQINNSILRSKNILSFLGKFWQKSDFELIQSVQESSSSIKAIVYHQNQQELISIDSQNHLIFLRGNNFEEKEITTNNPINMLTLGFNENHLLCGIDEGLQLIALPTKETIDLPLISQLKITIADGHKSDQVEVGQCKQLQLLATSVEGETFPLDSTYLEWKTTKGQINSQGLFTVTKPLGKATITVCDKFGLTKTCLDLTIIPEKPYLERLTFTQFKPSLEFYEEFCFKVQGLDQYGQPFNDISINWKASKGVINNLGQYLADDREETVIICAFAQDNQKEIIIEKNVNIVEPAQLSKLVITSSKSQLNPNETQQFTLQGFDQRQQTIVLGEIIWTGVSEHQTLWSVTDHQESQSFTIPDDFKGKITLTAHAVNTNITDTFEIIVPAILKQLKIKPNEQISLKPEQVQQFKVTAFDQCNDPFLTQDVKWDSSGGTIDKNGLFQANYQDKQVTITATLDSLSDSVTVTILPVLCRLEIYPFVTEFKTGEEKQFTVIGYDQFDQEYSLDKIIWEATGNRINSEGYFTAGDDNADVKITVMSEGINKILEVKIRKPPYLDTLEIRPSNVTLKPNQSQSFQVIARDQYGQIITLDQVKWSAEQGKITQTGYYSTSPYQKGECAVTVIGQTQKIKKESKAIIFVPSILQWLEICDQEVQLLPEEEYQFQVLAFDQCNDPFSTKDVKWDSSGGSIDKCGLFKANYQDKQVTITATLDKMSDSVTVTILPVLCRLEIYPFVTELKTGENQQFTVIGYDQFDQEYPLDKIIWEEEGNRIKQNGYFFAGDDTADVKITATSGGISKTIKVKIRQPSYLDTLEINPSMVTLEPNESIEFEVIGKDQYGKIITLDEIEWFADKGNITDWGYYSTEYHQQGYCSIMAIGRKNNIEKDSEAIVFVPAILQRIEIYDQEVTLLPEEEYQFQVLAFDQCNRPFKDINQVKWECSKGGSISSLGVFQGGYSKRKVTVTAIVDGYSATATVTLSPVLRKLWIEPRNVRLFPQESHQFTLQGRDQYGDPIDVNNINNIYWDATGGTITQSGLFTADEYAKGTYEVIAIALDSPLLSKKYRTIFQYIGISTRLTSWFISYEKLIQDVLRYLLSIEEDETKETEVNKEDQLDFNAKFEQWEIIQLRKLVARCLYQVSSFSFKLADAKVSASASVEVLPILRFIEIQPSSQQVKQGEDCQLKVLGFDQHHEHINIDEAVIWESEHQLIQQNNQQVLLKTNDLEGKIIVKAIVGDHESFAEITVLKSSISEPEYLDCVYNSYTLFSNNQLFDDAYPKKYEISYRKYLFCINKIIDTYLDEIGYQGFWVCCDDITYREYLIYLDGISYREYLECLEGSSYTEYLEHLDEINNTEYSEYLDEINYREYLEYLEYFEERSYTKSLECIGEISYTEYLEYYSDTCFHITHLFYLIMATLKKIK